MAVRVLMIIAAVIGFLIAAFCVFLISVPEAVEGMKASARGQGYAVSEGAITGIVGAVIGVVAGYSLISLVLALLLGRRSLGVYWTVMAFQILIALFGLLLVVGGGYGSIVFVLFAALLIGLLSPRSVRDYYRG
ncbi:hypothetical protein [Nocardiopsis ansamitocini]|uniref:hypothetical protein n=1 Tax=Nocardiopsis ansamitocini TaxID=1670832 RepID=UPI0025541285|nr:hypothetical protein [Nocardiopsis ansamitocini]